MTTMTDAEHAEYDARRTRVSRFKVLTGADFEAADYASDLIEKAVPGSTVLLGGHVEWVAETLIWHSPDGGWEAMVIDPAFKDPYCMSWFDSNWDARAAYFHMATLYGLALHGETPSALANAMVERLEPGVELNTALTLLVQAVPAPERSSLARGLSQSGATLLTADVVETYIKPSTEEKVVS